MKKIAIILLFVLIICGAVAVGSIIYNKNNNIQENHVTEISEVINDECTDEYEYEKSIAVLKTNSNEEKISPNAIITLKRNFTKCNHIIIEEKSVPTSIINKTEAEFQKEYEGWTIEKFKSDEIIISKDIDGYCNEEFVLRDVDGKIIIYKVDENNKEVEYEKTQIATQYLTDTDKISINQGLKVIGEEELNKVIEDFE